eukprot:TRINITY_DN10737_c0_g1_i2.p1 TRINITY_DN10737_c0_g1~~TRINITY_DN10737_c0_g1_i2.p1  ORF type:complete len:372 (+),score=111.97 TRINITY_DN10737_c0_g1_i2:522-1637(+)
MLSIACHGRTQPRTNMSCDTDTVFYVESKDKRRAPCTVEWADDEFRITCSGSDLYTVKWSKVEAVNVQPRMFGATLAVIDCVPEGVKSPLLVKLWLPSLLEVQVLSAALQRHNKRSSTGSSVLWGALTSTTLLPYYHRSANQFWRSLHFMLEVTLIAVTVFIFLDLLGMHDPGITDEAFPDTALDLLNQDTSLEELRNAMNYAVGNLSHEDQAIIAKRWKPFGWGYTLINDDIRNHKRRAIHVLGDNDYLAKPTKRAMRFMHRWGKYFMSLDYADLLTTHPYIVLVLPMALFGLVIGGAMFLWVAVAAVIVYCLKHVTVMVLSFKLVVIAKHIVLDAKSFYSAVKNILRIGTDSFRLVRTIAKRVLTRIHL